MTAIFAGNSFYQRITVSADTSVVLPIDARHVVITASPDQGAVASFAYSLTPSNLNNYNWIDGPLTDNGAKADFSFIAGLRLHSSGATTIFDVRWL